MLYGKLTCILVAIRFVRQEDRIFPPEIFLRHKRFFLPTSSRYNETVAFSQFIMAKNENIHAITFWISVVIE